MFPILIPFLTKTVASYLKRKQPKKIIRQQNTYYIAKLNFFKFNGNLTIFYDVVFKSKVFPDPFCRCCSEIAFAYKGHFDMFFIPRMGSRDQFLEAARPDKGGFIAGYCRQDKLSPYRPFIMIHCQVQLSAGFCLDRHLRYF